MAGIDAYTKLILHCDGDDESTTFTDSSEVMPTRDFSEYTYRPREKRFFSTRFIGKIVTVNKKTLNEVN